ncbi:MAG: sodium/proline symporter [Gemmatimonadetes bacterium]|nr:sodium/proline symporter [Gemmatimonadota bacterium]NNM04899.1 sodium/proline symporter [Gemmatimonadota bacterium]
MQEGVVASQIAVDGAALGSFLAYLLLLLAIGVYSSRFSSEGISEFFVGGRRMNRFVVALSAVVSGRSAWLLLGVTGMAYAMGASALWSVSGYTAAELILFLTYAKRLRLFSERHDCITLPDFFAARFGDEDGRLRLTLAVVILTFMVVYVASQFVGGGKAMAAGFGLTQWTGVLVTAAIVLGYTMVGGFLAVSLTDTIQALFMMVGLVILPVIAISAGGGWAPVMAELRAYDPAFVDPYSLAFGAWVGFVGIGLGSPGNPHILVRYMSIGDPDQLRWAAWVGTSWNVVMGAGAVLVGMAGRIYFPDVDQLLGADTENLYPMLAQLHLNPILFGIVVASIFAAIMSTADSQLLVAASALVRDFYQKVVKKDEEIPRRQLVVYSRITVALLVVVALILGWLAETLVFWLVLFAWAGLGAALGPTSILALYWKGLTRAGVFAGLITGTVVTFVWSLTPRLDALVYELIPAFFLGLVATVAVSLMTKPPPEAASLMRAMADEKRPAVD